MAEVTVNELAKTVGASVDRLLLQMKEAGLSHSSASRGWFGQVTRFWPLRWMPGGSTTPMRLSST